tara:strand:+ start:685 stop:1512 length:828 start_codon:yes stop_codon:yes gene_type:complete
MGWKDILKAKKPDFIDLDGDGNTTEPMSEAAKDVEKQTERKHPSLPSKLQMPPSKDFPKIKHTPMINFDSKKLDNILQREKELESIAHDEQDLKYLKTLDSQKLKQVLEARKRVSQGIPSDAGQRPRIPQFKKILKGYKDDMEELRERGLISGYDSKDVIEYEKGYEDRQIKRMLTDIEEWAEKFDWDKADMDDPIMFRQNRNKLYQERDALFDSGYVYYEINNYFEDLNGEEFLELGNLDDGFKLNSKLKNNPMKYKNEISQLYRDLTFERFLK